jgi:hypothetical protein
MNVSAPVLKQGRPVNQDDRYRCGAHHNAVSARFTNLSGNFQPFFLALSLLASISRVNLRRISSRIKAETVILDGEIVALDQAGVPCFDGLRSRRTAADCMIVYYAFDLLHLNGRDLTQTPLISRNASLKKILPRLGTGRIRYTDHVVGDGERLFAELERRQLEGMVAKRIESLYVSGRSRDWLKIKTSAGKEVMQKRSEAWGL